MSTTQSLKKSEAVCVGILAADPLRCIGLQAILEDGLKVRTYILGDDGRPRACKPSVLIIDDDSETAPGAAVRLSHTLARMPGVAVVVLARTGDSFSVHRALAAGARAVLPDTAEVADVRACIRAVLRGKTWVPRTSAAAEHGSYEASASAQAGLADRLTPKEREVMHSLTQGHSNREIAATMGIDEATVKAHLGRMLRKAEASNRVELTLRALAEQGTTFPVGLDSSLHLK